MYHELSEPTGRTSTVETIKSDLVVVGGGVAGVCCAISAARAGVKVTLVQDRPVLGGNASSEVRLWVLGATSHMGNNNRWSREGGVIGELLLENLFRNKEGNALIFDTIMLEKVVEEKNITLLLNTSVHATYKNTDNKISSVEGFCSQNSKFYELHGTYFCDASGDGIVAFQAGAEFRMGAEAKDEFSEKMAPDEPGKELLGHSIYFYSKDAGKPVKYVAPSFASIDGMTEDRMKRIRSQDVGPRLWWLEYGGNSETIGESEEIKWQLWKVVYGIWDYIKNSGNFENVDNLTLEWVGTIPGKRESRRFIGHSFITQQDIVEQRDVDDAVSFGGWAIDHHPGDGVYSNKPPCTQYHTKGVYQIPLGAFVSKDIDNLFYAGRIISSSHIAFGSTRVMATCGHGGHAVGEAVAYCLQQNCSTTDLLQASHIKQLQQNLNEKGHFIPNVPMQPQFNLASKANISASSQLLLDELPSNGPWRPLNISAGQLLPLQQGTAYQFTVNVRAAKPTTLCVQLRHSEKATNYTPEVILGQQRYQLEAGEHQLDIKFAETLAEDQYALLCFLANPDIEIACTTRRVSSLVSVFNGVNKAVSNTGKQTVEGDKGVDEFEFWTPERRPGGHNIALSINPPLNCFTTSNLTNGYTRAYQRSNVWCAATEHSEAELTLQWQQPQRINELILHFDADFDHALESSLYGHPEDRVPFCVERFQVLDDQGVVLYEKHDNHQAVVACVFSAPITSDNLRIKLWKAHEDCPIAIYEIIVK
ncbi:FAD-dependent oxidoreductase [Alteromonas sp. 1_MG-2023]|uniref:FAD-dependent oxidoreductase n=1 Tax=Alteromonas sp. 1_MG-2023 TaxID=3062669 RepID=UPI0026E3D4C2|nr:FAD-dependent oxidoreductase [Alteromonas sp. 1_MG-2023]MDO6566508.1 FAD-dependent oxidoreductase [Alteromonas sp. 1_MG-2023]